MFRAPRNRLGLRGIRYLAGLVATFCLLGQVSSIAHNLLVRHATCAEHGELIHESSEQRPALAGTTEDAQIALRASDTGEPGEGHGHEHCLAVAHGRGHVGLDAAATATDAGQANHQSIALEARPFRSRSLSLYRLAPKNSPPA